MLGAMLGVVADQMTKAAAFAHVAERGDWEVAPFLAITAGMNPGIAFGLATTVHPAMLIAVAGAISIVLVLMIRRSAGWLRTAALGAILGGAAGTLPTDYGSAPFGTSSTFTGKSGTGQPSTWRTRPLRWVSSCSSSAPTLPMGAEPPPRRLARANSLQER